VRLIRIAIAALLAVGAVFGEAAAKPPPLRIEVTDARTHSPVALARVLLIGPSTVAGYTDMSGVVNFDDLTVGTYTGRVLSGGYREADLPEIRIDDAGAISIAVSLAPDSGPQVIGTVRTRSSIAAQADRIGRDDPGARVRGSLQDALDDGGSASASASGGLSIEGHSASQTAYQIDGVTLPGIGTSGLRGVSADLFGSVSVERGATNGSIAGAVNFRTLEPTLNFQSLTRAGFDSNDRGLLSSSARGTVGSIGFIASHAAGGTSAPMDTLTFADTSGETYEHRARTRQIGDLVKLRIPLAERHSLSVTYLFGSSLDDVVCVSDATVLPCGNGPNNVSSTRLDAGIFSYRGSSGSVSISLDAATASTRARIDDRKRLFLGIPLPADDRFGVSGKTVSLALSAPLGERHSLALHATTVTSAFSSSGSETFAVPSSTATWQRFALDDALSLGRGRSVVTTIGAERSAGATNLSGAVAANIQLPRKSAVSASLAFDRGAPSPFALGGGADPESLRYNCSDGVAIGAAAGDTLTAPSSRSIRAGWSRDGTNAGVSLSAFDTLVHGDVLSSYAPASFLGYPATYLDQVQRIFHDPRICGARPLSGPEALLSVPVSGLTTQYRGALASTTFGVTRALLVTAYLGYERAYDLSLSPVLLLPSATVRPGAQLAGVPFLKAGAAFDYKPPASSIEALAVATYVSNGNQRDLPSYVDLAAGLAAHTARGVVVARVTNIFNAHASVFAATRDAVSLTMRGGGSVPTDATPFAPRAFGLSWTFAAGTTRDPRTVSASAFGGLTAAQDTAYQFLPEPLPQSPPPDALQINRGSTSCQPELAGRAQAALTEIARLVASVEKRSGAGPIAPGAVDVPPSAGFTASYVANGNSYAIVLTIGKALTRTLIPCAHVHGTDGAEAAQRGLYAGSDTRLEHVYVYAPSVGLYFVSPDGDQTPEAVTFQPVPAAPPIDPLALSATCPARYEALSRAFVEAVQTAQRGPALTESRFRVLARGGGDRRWFEVEGVDALTLVGLAQCLPVVRVGQAEAAAAVIPGARAPKVNVSARYGIYVIVP
jgi:hypothetical protein